MDEMAQLTSLRAEVPEPGMSELRAEEARLMAAIAGTAGTAEPAPARRRTKRRVLVRLGIAGGLAAAAVAAGVVVSVGSGPGSPQSPVVLPSAVAPVAVAQTLDRAAEAALHQPELHPRPGQFLVFRSRDMEEVDSSSDRGATRYLVNTRRTVWRPVAGPDTQGVLEEEVLAPKALPGSPLPPEARQGLGKHGPDRLAESAGRAADSRNDYAYTSRLPTDTEGMRRHLYTGLNNAPDKTVAAWQRVGDLLAEAYMPAAQRAALLRAAATIPGVEAVASAKDAAGREGAAVALTDTEGMRQEYIFDRRTHTFLGARTVVVDAAAAGLPKGTVTESTAQLGVQVSDTAPAIKEN
jgi:hypothetical protein